MLATCVRMWRSTVRLYFGTGTPPDADGRDGDYFSDPVESLLYGPKASGAWPAGVAVGGGSSTSIPAGVIVMWAGLLADVPTGWALCDGTAGTPDLRDRFVKGWAAGVDPGGTGGASTHTPTGSNSAPTFTGAALAGHAHGTGTYSISAHAGSAVADHAAHTHAVTSNVAVGNHSFTQPTIAWPVGVPTAANESAHTHSVTSNVSGTLTPAGTIAWPVGVPTISGIAVSDHAAHTHSVTAAGTNSAPTFTGNAVSITATATPKLFTTNTSTGTGGTVTATGSVTAPTFTGSAVTSGNPSATLTHTVSSQGTVAWPAGVPTFTGTTNQALSMTNPAVTSGAGSAHTHTLSWPAGVPTATSGAVDAHSVTNNAVTSGNPSATLSHSVTQPNDHTLAGSTDSVSAGTPAGTVSAPNFTGDSASYEPAYYKLAFIMKT